MTGAVRWQPLGPVSVSVDEAVAGAAGLVAAAQPDDPLTGTWWQVTDTAVVLGRGSDDRSDHGACEAAGVSVLRRDSGGGPVLWSPRLMALDVVVPRLHNLHDDDVTASYRWLGEAITNALVSQGVRAHAVPTREARATNDSRAAALACFAGRSPWEVVVDDVKVVGLSQVRRRTATLLQAGIRMMAENPPLETLLAITDEERTMITRALTLPHDLLTVDPEALRRAIDRAIDSLLAPASA